MKNPPQITLNITVVITIVGILAAGLSSYFGGRLAVEHNFSDLRERIATVEAKITSVEEVKQNISISNENIANLWSGVATLLNDRGYDPVKVLGKIKP